MRPAMDDTRSKEQEEQVEEVLRLTYSSQAVEPFDEAALVSLLAHAREKNTRMGLSGMLLYAAPTFLQVLEGDPEVVESVYAEIEADPRHDEMRVLLRETEVERLFGDWTMGFVQADREMLESIEGLNGFLQTEVRVHTETREDAEDVRAAKILEQFREGRWRRRVES